MSNPKLSTKVGQLHLHCAKEERRISNQTYQSNQPAQSWPFMFTVTNCLRTCYRSCRY